MRNLSSKSLLVTFAAVGALYAGALRAEEAKLVQTNLVSSQGWLPLPTPT